MTSIDSPVSKILVLDNSAQHSRLIREFCEQNQLAPLKLRKDVLISVLRTNIDLGGILYSEDYGDTEQETYKIAAQIHAMRPEVPIIIRRVSKPTLEDLPERARGAFCAAYVASDMDALKAIVSRYIFCLVYPNALLRGIAEITSEVLAGEFPTRTLKQATPFIVHDRIISGEVMSLIQLESAWCRGYMMLQTEEESFLKLIGGAGPADSRLRVGDALAEVTNRIWGSFKNRFIGASRSSGQAQVPVVVSHKHKYISFGTQNPQLCFRYTLSDATHSCTLDERFVFNLDWTPEDFKEIAQDSVDLVKSGELELF